MIGAFDVLYFLSTKLLGVSEREREVRLIHLVRVLASNFAGNLIPLLPFDEEVV